MREYKFFFDKDSQAAAKFFPERRVITLAQAKVCAEPIHEKRPEVY
jgi:hypothetical protein